jgi:hypothetical protein
LTNGLAVWFNLKETRMKLIVAIFSGIALIIMLGLLMSLPVMLLWNGCLVGAITGVQSIGWLQAWGILVLSGLLFKTTISSK